MSKEYIDDYFGGINATIIDSQTIRDIYNPHHQSLQTEKCKINASSHKSPLSRSTFVISMVLFHGTSTTHNRYLSK